VIIFALNLILIFVKRNLVFLSLWIIAVFFISCEQETVDTNISPVILLNTETVQEQDQTVEFHYTVRVDPPLNEDLILYVTTRGMTAYPEQDFVGQKKREVIIPAGKSSSDILIEILGDTIMEFTEQFEIQIEYDTQTAIQSLRSVITIENDDYIEPELASDGYSIPMQYPGMKIIWQDEFDKEQLNAENWNYDAANAFPVNCGGNDQNVIGKYTGDPGHLRIEEGKLHLTATFDPATGIYRTSRINSKEKVNVQYGRIDFRAKLAAGNGLASSLMMLGEIGEWPAAGEIDILKMAGKEPGSITGGLVYGAEDIKSIEKKSVVLNEPLNLTDHFHIYTILWEENRIHWLRDYKPYFTVSRENFPDKYIFNNPFFIKINLAVGGNFAGLPNLFTEFPCRLEVDYIRVYQPITANINE
jgi:hypothetical protein